jgi:hypothetical protein
LKQGWRPSSTNLNPTRTTGLKSFQVTGNAGKRSGKILLNPRRSSNLDGQELKVVVMNAPLLIAVLHESSITDLSAFAWTDATLQAMRGGATPLRWDTAQELHLLRALHHAPHLKGKAFATVLGHASHLMKTFQTYATPQVSLVDPLFELRQLGMGPAAAGATDTPTSLGYAALEQTARLTYTVQRLLMIPERTPEGAVARALTAAGLGYTPITIRSGRPTIALRMALERVVSQHAQPLAA